MNGMKQRFRKLTLRFAMIAILLLANLPMYSGYAGARELTLTASVNTITDTTAYLFANTDADVTSETIFGVVVKDDENQTVFSWDSLEEDSNTLSAPLYNLKPGKTYTYHAYVNDGSITNSDTKYFTTASVTGIDVKDMAGTILPKDQPFIAGNKSYTVHVPHDTVSVYVYETANLPALTIPLIDTLFSVLPDDINSPEEWSPTVSGNTYASHLVTLESDVTTVCVRGLKFQTLNGVTNEPCGDYYHVEITRDAVPTAPTVTTLSFGYVTDETAILSATANGFEEPTSVGFEIDVNANLSGNHAHNKSGDLDGTHITTHAGDLAPGTIYYYRAYVQDGENWYYGDTKSFMTAGVTAIDVTNGGTTYPKTLMPSSALQSVYSVHVPHNTESVSITETVYLADAISPVLLQYLIVGGNLDYTDEWSIPDINLLTSATIPVNLTSDITTVCVAKANFYGLGGQGTPPGPCDDYQYEIQIIRDAPTVETLSILENTDKSASLKANTSGFDHLNTTVGFELSEHADMSGKSDIVSVWPNSQDNYIFKHIYNSLTTPIKPGTTYFYKAYVDEEVEEVTTRYYGGIQSFTMAAFTGIDVKDSNGTIIPKTPSEFAIGTKKYTVHVPFSTARVSVSQNVYLGTSVEPFTASFTVLDAVNQLPTSDWSLPDHGNISANQPVDVTSNVTTVCVDAPAFERPANIEPTGPCSYGQYEVEIIRDAAPDNSTPTPPAKTVKVIVTEQGGNVANVPVTQLGESKLPMSAQLFTTDGVSLNLPDIAISADGSFILPNVPAGQYHMVLSVVAPTGEKLAGRPATLTVDASGNAQIESELIDPYGIITDEVTGKVIEGAHATLHWADTALNRSKGRKPGDLVILPILPDFAPNQNKDPQDSNAKGEYGWMVFPDGDYYILASKAGYNDFDSRTTGDSKDAGKDSYVENGVIHIGQAIESYDFMMEPIAKETGKHNNYIAGYPDGTFGPDRNITRAEVAAVFARITNDYQLVLNANDANSFNDVSDTHWAKEYIENVRASGLMLGSSASTFRPEAPITRGEVAAIVARYKKLGPVEEAAFTDTAESWAKGAINAVKKANIISGYDNGTFLPDQNIVRKEFVIMINRMLGRGKLQNIKEPLWSDVPTTNFYFADIQEASTTHNYAIYENGAEIIKK
jgi:hypothetical protein